jgi:NADH dehydrogenase FAD-containing subunit
VEAPKLLIVGGGPVGVELAGEIIVDFPQKKVNVNLHVSIFMFLLNFRFLHRLVGMHLK